MLIALLVGIGIVNLLCNLIAKPSQQAGVPYPVVCRATFGVLGANIPAIIRGLIAVAWYGIQTYLASTRAGHRAAQILAAPRCRTPTSHQHGFVGPVRARLGGFMVLWVLQALVFWRGMETISKFIDFAGPAVYVVMFVLARLPGVARPAGRTSA